MTCIRSLPADCAPAPRRAVAVRLAALALMIASASVPLRAEDLVLAAPEPLGACRRIAPDEASNRRVRLRETFRDDFDRPPLADGRWTPHFQGSDKFPREAYVRGPHSDVKRRLKGNGEQQIYVDPGFHGLSPSPLGLDPFAVSDGLLSIRAEPTPDGFRQALFGADYVSGILSTHESFRQKYGYFEIRSRVPFGRAVWPAFWLLREDAVWPPEIDVFEGRGTKHGVLAMSLHWKVEGNRPGTCSTDVTVPDADRAFHTYGVLWEPNAVTWYVDRKPVFTAPPSTDLDRPMYMLVNLAIGSKTMSGVGQIDETTPRRVDFVVDRIATWSLTAAPGGSP